ncbi:metal-dependent hydrolase, partial [Pseudomonas aeruginosa]|nr:metal-dependent hydrolase [Pseudomonas aeruginosa]
MRSSAASDVYKSQLPDYHQLEFDLRVYLTWKSL